MSNYYTEKIIKPLIITALEAGDFSLRQIALAYNVSLSFVRRVADNYEIFYIEVIKNARNQNERI